MIGLNGRYFADFAFFIILPSLFCAFYWYDNKEGIHHISQNIRMKVVYVLLAASVFVGLSLFVVGLGMNSYLDPVLHRYLEYSLSILRKV
jgi:hypothetical protein